MFQQAKNIHLEACNSDRIHEENRLHLFDIVSASDMDPIGKRYSKLGSHHASVGLVGIVDLESL